jgi:hypothetical protein
MVNKFAFTSASLGDWSVQGQPTWSILEAKPQEAKKSRSVRRIKQSTAAAAAAATAAPTGAVVSFSSSLANCTASAGSAPSFYSTSITFVCDSAGFYPLHGPLDLENSGPCAWEFQMKTILACSPAQRQQIPLTRSQRLEAQKQLQQQGQEEEGVLLR